MQATCHQDNTVSHKDEEIKATPRVSLTWVLSCYNVAVHQLHRPKLTGVKKKLDRREAVRERKALAAAHVEKSIQKELLERLKSKAYGDAPLNVNEHVWQAILDREKGSKSTGQTELDMQEEETDEEELEELEEDWPEQEFVSDISDEDMSDLEEASVRF